MTDRNAQSPSPESRIPRPGGPVFALIAGEASGDQLGGPLITALRARYPLARFVGVGGSQMTAAGLDAWHDIGELSVMGFAEVVKHLPRLLKLRRTLTRRLLALRPDITIGIDAPDFNLGLEQRLKRAGLSTVHYVSPSVWAWREQRVEKIGRSADRVLCLFPMEPPIYARHGVDARFVGHPLADRFPMQGDRDAARVALGLPLDATVLAVLPGSRSSEIERLGAIFLDAAKRVSESMPNVRVIVPTANARCRDMLESILAGPGTRDPGPAKALASSTEKHPPQTPDQGAAHASSTTVPAPSGPGSRVPGPVLLDGHAHEAMLAADVVLLASGTATLEAMLAKRAMVVGYRVAPLSYRIARALNMLKTDIYALPNILARAGGLSQAPVVPELMQDDCTARGLADAVLTLLSDGTRRERIADMFAQLHDQLRGDLDGSAADHAANAIAELLERR